MAEIRIKDLPLATGGTAPTGTDAIAIDGLTTRKTTISALGDVAVPVASQAEAESGTDASKRMTPLTTKQSIASEVGDTIASAAQGALASTALQPGEAATPAQGAKADSAMQLSEIPTAITVGQTVKFFGVDGSTTPGITVSGQGFIVRHTSDGDMGQDARTMRIDRVVNQPGGTAGFVNAGIDAHIQILNSTYASYEWSLLGRVDNSSDNGEPVGVYGQGNRRGGNGAVWGGVMEARDHTGLANPPKGLVGLEVDVRAEGADNSNNRLGIDVVCTHMDDAVATPVQIGYGVRVSAGFSPNVIVKRAFYVAAPTQVGFDTAAATIYQAAIRMAQGQAIAFDAGLTQQLSFDGIGLRYASGGVTRVQMLGEGSISLNAGNVKIKGNNAFGTRTPTLGNQLPGTSTTTTPYRWIEAEVNGVKGWIPFFRDVD